MLSCFSGCKPKADNSGVRLDLKVTGTPQTTLGEYDRSGNNSLLYAASSANKDLLKKLIIKGWDTTATNKEGKNILHLAAASEQSGAYDCIKLILSTIHDREGTFINSVLSRYKGGLG